MARSFHIPSVRFAVSKTILTLGDDSSNETPPILFWFLLLFCLLLFETKSHSGYSETHCVEQVGFALRDEL